MYLTTIISESISCRLKWLVWIDVRDSFMISGKAERSPRPPRPHPPRRVELADSVSTRERERLVQPVASSWCDSLAFTCVCLPGSDPVHSSRRPARRRAGRTAVTPTSSVAGSHWGFKLNRLGYVTLRGRQLAPHPPTRQPPLKCSGSTFPSQQGQKTC